MHKGSIRYRAWIEGDTGKIYFEEWVLRTKQMRKCRTLYWLPPREKHYWVQKIKGLTWVKQSNKHFDWGWSKNIPAQCRHTENFSNKLNKVSIPFSATKAGALRDLEKREKVIFQTVRRF